MLPGNLKIRNTDYTDISITDRNEKGVQLKPAWPRFNKAHLYQK